MSSKKDIIKALRCMASHDYTTETCYKDYHPGIWCGNVKEGRCPYYQYPLETYIVDGDASWMSEAADAVEELEAVKRHISRKMEEKDIPDWAYAVYNDVKVFMWGFERVKERENDL